MAALALKFYLIGFCDNINISSDVIGSGNDIERLVASLKLFLWNDIKYVSIKKYAYDL